MTSIVASDILFKLSAPTAVAGNTLSATPGNSWGNFISTTTTNSAISLNSLFQDLSGAQNAGGQVDYACLFIHNNTFSGKSMQNVIVWLPLNLMTQPGAAMAVGSDPTPASIYTSTSQQAVVISSAVVAPAGINTWISPTNTQPSSPSYINGLQLGTVLPGYCAAIWVRRTAQNTVPVLNDSVTIQVDFGTA